MTGITVLETKAAKDNAMAIEYLQTLLNQARSGDLLQFVAIARYSDGEYESVWTRNSNMVEVSGMCARLQYLVNREMDPD